MTIRTTLKFFSWSIDLVLVAFLVYIVYQVGCNVLKYPFRFTLLDCFCLFYIVDSILGQLRREIQNLVDQMGQDQEPE